MWAEDEDEEEEGDVAGIGAWKREQPESPRISNISQLGLKKKKKPLTPEGAAPQ